MAGSVVRHGLFWRDLDRRIGGEGGSRTLGTRERTPDFESGPFGHSGTSPVARGSTQPARARYIITSRLEIVAAIRTPGRRPVCQCRRLLFVARQFLQCLVEFGLDDLLVCGLRALAHHCLQERPQTPNPSSACAVSRRAHR
jgi:hypothetical protein